MFLLDSTCLCPTQGQRGNGYACLGVWICV